MIEFGTGGFRGIIGDDFTKENVQIIAQAISSMMKEDDCLQKIVVGFDYRFMSDKYAEWMAEVFAGNQIEVLLYDTAIPSPAVMFATDNLCLDYGVMITASHNPFIFNGVKLFTKGGYDADVQTTSRVEKQIAKTQQVNIKSFCKAKQIGLIKPYCNIEDYVEHICSFIDPAVSSNNAKVLFDNLYGVGIVGLKRIAKRLNIKQFDMLHTNHDAFFNFQLPNPTEEMLNSLKKTVVECGYDFAIATDSDGDRLGVIDDKGNYVNNNDILAMLYYYLVKYRNQSGDVVKNCATSILVDKVAEQLGFCCHEVDVGFKNISSAIKQYDALIGGESSGGLTCRGYIFGKDSAFSSSLFMEMQIIMNKPVSEIVKVVHQFANYTHVCVEKTIPIAGKDEVYSFLQHNVPDFSRKLLEVRQFGRNHKYIFENGSWALYRFSGTEPMLRLFVEAENTKETQRLAKLMMDFVDIKEFYERKNLKVVSAN